LVEKKLNFDEVNINKKFKRGLFDSDKYTASNNTLNKYHKIGIDPGNKTLLYCVSETGKKIEINKGYYNEISHITKNNQIRKNKLRAFNMSEIYSQLAETGYKKTIDMDIYNKFIIVIRNNWKKLYNFYGRNNIQMLELDSYINKKKAIHKIIRKIVPKNNKKHNFKQKDKLLCSNEEYNDILRKPLLLAFGKGSGNMTISNLKNNSPKGPVKTLAKELSKFTTVLITDEYKTSQVCPICQEQTVIHPKVEKKYKKKKLIDGEQKVVDVVKMVDHYKLCYCSNNNKHPQSEGSPPPRRARLALHDAKYHIY
jgi:hypothetical protein